MEAILNSEAPSTVHPRHVLLKFRNDTLLVLLPACSQTRCDSGQALHAEAAVNYLRLGLPSLAQGLPELLRRSRLVAGHISPCEAACGCGGCRAIRAGGHEAEGLLLLGREVGLLQPRCLTKPQALRASKAAGRTGYARLADRQALKRAEQTLIHVPTGQHLLQGGHR